MAASSSTPACSRGETADVLVKNSNIAMSTYSSAVTPLLRYELGVIVGLPAGPSLGDCSAALATDGFGVGVTFAGESVTHTTECVATPWWQAAGDLATDGTRRYPALPQLPTFERPGSQSTIGSCNHLLPGPLPRHHAARPERRQPLLRLRHLLLRTTAADHQRCQRRDG